MTSRVVARQGDAEAAVRADARPSICALFAARAEQQPEHTAVVDAGGLLTYRDLYRRSSVLAGWLIAAGVGAGSCVAVFLERSADFVVAALAVMRAGAAYLPLDVATPAERVRFVLADAGVAVVVRGGAPARRIPAGPWRSVETSEAITPLAGPFTLVDPAPDDLAYIIYTSGSTGRPKGVELTHANLTHLVEWHVGTFAVTAADRAGQGASVGFDAAVWEIWPALAAGATLHVAGEATRRSAPLLRDWLLTEGVTVTFAPTALAEQLVHLPWPAGTALRTLLTGADVLHRRPPAGLPFTLVNNYGPTECTVVATSGPVAPAGDDAPGTAPAGVPSIGRPIGDTTALILDDALQPVAPGRTGELCLAGSLVGRGYRNDPELTTRRFVSLPCESGTTQRVYRTGDRARLLDSGEIAFVGRLDRQVKLRGYRIEPAEIVAALDEVSGVAAAAVALRTVAEGDADVESELVAYVVPGAGAAPTADELRAAVAARLPDYMNPTRFVGLDALPMTMNGKLDEAALPVPSPANLLPGEPDAGSVAAEPAGESVQEQVAAMVCALLKLPSIDLTDNIFLVGGHSMLAMQLVARIKKVLGVQLTLRQLFEQPTVAGIAATVSARAAAEAHS